MCGKRSTHCYDSVNFDDKSLIFRRVMNSEEMVEIINSVFNEIRKWFLFHCDLNRV